MPGILRKKCCCILCGNIMISCVSSLMLVCIVFLLTMYSIRLRTVNEAVIQIEDGLAAACLSGLNVDMQRYRETYLSGKKDIVISDYEQSFRLFNDSLKTNLQLDSGAGKIYDNVKVLNYIIYNVYQNEYNEDEKIIEIYYFGENGLTGTLVSPYSSVYAPNGIEIKQTSVYADIQFQLEVYGSGVTDCHKQLLVEADKR